jgi:hypothetical protein
LYCYTITG